MTSSLVAVSRDVLREDSEVRLRNATSMAHELISHSVTQPEPWICSRLREALAQLAMSELAGELLQQYLAE